MNKNVLNNLALAAVMASVVTACQTMPYQPYARDVKKKPQQGGIIALRPEYRDEDRAKAQQMMAVNCANYPVKVLEEGEVAVGQETKSSNTKTKGEVTKSQQLGSLFGIGIGTSTTTPSEDTTGSSVVTSVKEWQISYECVAPVRSNSKR